MAGKREAQGYMPILLQGRRVIAVTFRVRPCVVTQWAREGAPIFQSGQMWQADYGNLVRWLERHSKVVFRG